MADYFTHFSCLLDVGTPENAARALALYNALSEEGASEEPPSEGFLLSIQPEHGGTALWMRDDVTGDALVLTIDRAYFDLTGGLDRWLYRLVRKHGGKQRHGWRFDFRHLHLKSGSLSPFKRFAFELRDIVRRQPLPGYVLFLEVEARGRTLLAFKPSVPGGKPVEGVVPSGTARRVPSGTSGSCQREPDQGLTLDSASQIRVRNLDSNQESNFEERAREVRSLIDTVRNSLTVNARQRRSPAGAP